MAIKAIATITLHAVVDVAAVYRYYKLQSATADAPSKPTVKPSDPLKNAPEGWSVTEPSYSTNSTDKLYTVDLNVFSDGTFNYSNVSLSSSYEAAKAAYNKATNAQGAAESAQNATNNLQADFNNEEVSMFSALSIDGGTTLASYNLAVCLETGTITNGSDADSSTDVRTNEYVKVSGGKTYVWNVKDASNETVTPTAFFYSLTINSETGAATYTYLSSQTAASITVPSGNDVFLRCTMTEIRSEETETVCTLSLDGIDSILTNGSATVHIGLHSTLKEYPSVNPDNYEWSLADSAIMANSQVLFDVLSNKLYDEDGGDIKNIFNAIKEAKNAADAANERIDDRNKHIQILSEEAVIRLLADGNDKAPSSEVKLTSEKISFMRGGVEGAYIGYPDAEKSDRTAMAASTTYFTEMFARTEDPNTADKWIGQLCLIARSNGHLSLKVVK